MAKDPAFLFYSQDFFLGVSELTFEERGQYISLLCLMHQKGRMKIETIRFLVGSVSDNLIGKFKQDDNGFYYNERLEIEVEKRNNFTKSRRDNGLKGGRPKESDDKKPNGKSKGKHKANLMGNENEIENVIEYLNKKACLNFRSNSEKNKKPIQARLNENFTPDDFYTVIDHKVAAWLTDSKMKEYLRPETLFGTKFESYLQAARSPTVSEKSNLEKTHDAYQTVLNQIQNE